MKVLIPFTLDVKKTNVQKIIHANQGEGLDRKLIITLVSGSEPLILDSENQSVQFVANKPDGTTIYNSTAIKDGKVIIYLTSQTTAAVGDVDCQLEVVSTDEGSAGSGVVYSAKFTIAVEEALYDAETVQSSNEFTELIELIERAEKQVTVYPGEGTPSTDPNEFDNIKESDFYYDSTNKTYRYAKSVTTTIVWEGLISATYFNEVISYINETLNAKADVSAVNAALELKQDKLTEGVNINIEDEILWELVSPEVSPYEDYIISKNGNVWENNPTWYKHCVYNLPSGGLTIKFSAKGYNSSYPAIIWLDENDNVIGYYGETNEQLTDETKTLPSNAVKVILNGVNNSTFALSYKIEQKTIGTNTSFAWKGILPQTSPYENYIISKNGTLWENNPTWYKHCLYLLPTGATKIKFSGKGHNSSCPAIIWFDENNNYIGSYGTTTEQLNNVELTLPSNAKKVYINGVNNSTFALSYKTNISLLNITTNSLYGKKISINGDSIAYGQGYPGGVLKLIADNYNMTLDNVAVAGGTLTSGDNESVHHICDTLNTMANDADYYIIMGGYNDYNYNVNQLGSLTQTMSADINKNTVYGALEYICRTLLTTYPTKKIGFIITHKILNSAYTNKKFTMQQLHDAIVDVCKKYSISYCDIFELSQFNTELDIYKVYTKTSDGIHPTKDGYELFYYPKVENWLKSL